MGQYFYIVNVTKGQYLHPHKFGEGLKLMEFGSGGCCIAALSMLLADGDPSGFGDLEGSWVGDCIIFAGDYAEPGAHVSPEALAEYEKRFHEIPTLHQVAQELYADVSFDAIRALCKRPFLRRMLQENLSKGWVDVKLNAILELGAVIDPDSELVKP